MTINGQDVTIVSAHPGDSLTTMLVNNYSALSITPYWRAQDFLATNMASFSRSVYFDGTKTDQPHALDKVLKRCPNQYQTAYVFWRNLFFDMSHRRNAYAEIRRDRVSFNVSSLHLWKPCEV